MGIKIYGMRQSTCTQRVLIALAEKRVTDYELVIVNLFAGEQTLPAHLALQPFAKIPVLEDDGYFVYESRAICKYIARKYAGQGNKIIPAEGDLKAYGLFEQVSFSIQCPCTTSINKNQACSVELSYFEFQVGSNLLWEAVFKV